MAQNTTVTVPAKTWTQLTDGNVTAITFQNVGSEPVHIKMTATATAPTDISGSLVYAPRQGERNVALADLAPGVASAARVYAWASAAAKVMVSNA